MNAGFFVRLAAYLIDCLIVGAALLVIRIPTTLLEWTTSENILVKDFIFQYSVLEITCYLLSAAYFILLTYFTGATIGKKVFHLRVISTEDRKLTFFEVAFRETVGRFLSKLIIYVGYFMIGIHKNKWALHDMLSDTEVVYFHEKRVEVETPVAEKETKYTSGEYAAPTYAVPNNEHTSEEDVSEMVKEEEIAESPDCDYSSKE